MENEAGLTTFRGCTKPTAQVSGLFLSPQLCGTQWVKIAEASAGCYRMEVSFIQHKEISCVTMLIKYSDSRSLWRCPTLGTKCK